MKFERQFEMLFIVLNGPFLCITAAKIKEYCLFKPNFLKTFWANGTIWDQVSDLPLESSTDSESRYRKQLNM